MSRILVTTNAAIGHFLPMAPTIAALAARGHDVRVGCPEGFAEFVGTCGFTAIAGQERPVDPRVPPAPPADDRAERLRWAVVHSWPADCRSWVDDLLSAARRWRPELVVVEPVEHAGRVGAAALGVPLAIHGWGFPLPAETHRLAAEGLADLYASAGCEPVHPQLTVDLGPAVLEPTGAPTVARYAYVPWPSEGEALPPRSGAARVLVTLGTYPNPKAAASIRAASRAALAQGAEVVVVLGNADRGGADGLDGAHVVAWTDMRAAVAGSDLVLHHGGAGTSWTTLVEGRPAVVLPQAGDQFANAERLAAAGAAVVVEDDRHLSSAIARALDDEGLQLGARRISQQNAVLPGPGELAQDLALLASA